MKEISTSTYSFSDLIENGYLYVDKTDYIYRLVKTPKGEYFYSRPRRFGKSLTVSTLEALFRGRRELFEGLKIAQTDYAFEEHPVIHIDFGRSDSSTVELLTSWLHRTLEGIAAEYGVSAEGESPAIAFGTLIQSLYAKYRKGVVILIDEYDRPVTNSLEDGEKAEKLRKLLEAFFQIVKGYEGMCRFIFLTGITRLAQLSIFSKLNNLRDISRSSDYACMMGYTQEELDRYFAGYIRTGAAQLAMTEQELKEQLKYWYDGFCFSPDAERVYNPVSVGMFFSEGFRFENYWYETATPVMLVQQARKQQLTLQDMEHARYTDSDYRTFNIMALTEYSMKSPLMIQLLFQTGYLTIGDRVQGPVRPTWKLVYPNHEVQSSFEVELTSIYTDKIPQEISSCVSYIQEAAWNGNADEMIRLMHSLLAGIPYSLQLKHEFYYQSLMLLLFRICGMDIQAESQTGKGRIDAVMQAGNYMYIIECKFNQQPQQAIDQIDDRKYADMYRIWKDKKIIGIGLSFCMDKSVRNLEEKYLVEELS